MVKFVNEKWGFQNIWIFLFFTNKKNEPMALSYNFILHDVSTDSYDGAHRAQKLFLPVKGAAGFQSNVTNIKKYF